MTIRTSTKTTEINKTTLATAWAIKNEENKSHLTEKDVPEQYKNYADVFSEEKAKQFPPTREEDHKIKFAANIPKFFKAKVYQMSTKQVTFLRKWLDKELKKGFIRTSKSPYPSPTFLIEKKNGDY